MATAPDTSTITGKRTLMTGLFRMGELDEDEDEDKFIR
jgi:hypothetical protein